MNAPMLPPRDDEASCAVVAEECTYTKFDGEGLPKSGCGSRDVQPFGDCSRWVFLFGQVETSEYRLARIYVWVGCVVEERRQSYPGHL